MITTQKTSIQKALLQTSFVASTVFAATHSFALESDFNLALSAANSGNIGAVEQYRWSMSNDVLGYYPEYFILNKNLSSQPASSIADYAKRYAGSAMAEKLAADYVEEKVKIGDYYSAQQVVQYVNNPDQAESCAIVLANMKTGDTLSVASKREAFFATDTQPELCNQLGGAMVQSSLMSQQDKQSRFWGLLRSGLSGQALSTGMAIGVRLDYAQLSQIERDPQGYLWSAPKNNSTDYAYLIYALGRLASNDLQSALYAVDRAVESTPKEVQLYLYRTVAYIGGTTVGKNGFNLAVFQNFKKSEGYPFSPEEAVIYARQALRFSQWQSLSFAISQMTPAQQDEDRWQYWLARAYEKTGNAQYKSIYQKLAQSGDDYHHLWAKARLGLSFSHSHYQPTTQDYARLGQDIHFRRAFALREINAPAAYANREWNWAVRNAVQNKDDGVLLAAAKRANDMGWYERGIYAADRTQSKHNHSYRYVTPYRDQVVSSSQNVGINAGWAYGIMRQESRFNVNAKSGVGAGGLMQVMPDTARLIAREFGESYNASTVNSAYGNIRYGTKYLSMLLNDMYNPVVATAGYNAGPNRAKRWQPNDVALEADQYTESIPFLETREYVKHVMTNATHYNVVLGQGNGSIQQRMPQVPVRW